MTKYEPILITKSGSHLYGTNIESSDVDIRGIIFPPLQSLLGLGEFEQSEEPYDGYKDTTLYGLKKFCQFSPSRQPKYFRITFRSN